MPQVIVALQLLKARWRIQTRPVCQGPRSRGSAPVRLGAPRARRAGIPREDSGTRRCSAPALRELTVTTALQTLLLLLPGEHAGTENALPPQHKAVSSTHAAVVAEKNKTDSQSTHLFDSLPYYACLSQAVSYVWIAYD